MQRSNQIIHNQTYFSHFDGRSEDVRCKMDDGIVIYENGENYAARAGIDDKWLYITYIWAARFDKNYAVTMP